MIPILAKGIKKENPEGSDYKRATGIGRDEEFGPSFKGLSSPSDRNRCSFPLPCIPTRPLIIFPMWGKTPSPYYLLRVI